MVLEVKEVEVLKPEELALDIPNPDIAQEIAQLHQEVLASIKIGLSAALRIGELLTEQKARLKHGQFTNWITGNLPFTDRTARNYMRLHENRDQLKTETVSVLKDAYKMLTAPGENTRLERPWEMWYELKGKLMVMNEMVREIDPLIEQERDRYFAYEDNCLALSSPFLKLIQDYLDGIESQGDNGLLIREYAWADKILFEITNAWAERNLYIEAYVMGPLLNFFENEFPEGFKFLKANSFSDKAYESLHELLQDRIKELEAA